MTQIDFLPDSYRRAQKRRGRVARTVLLTAIAAGVLVVATVGLKAHRVSLERTAARIEDTVKTEKGSLGVLAGLQSEQEQLLKRLELREQLLPPVSYAQIISAISQTIPDEVAVTEMVMKSVHPKPEPIETDAEREEEHAGDEAGTDHGRTLLTIGRIVNVARPGPRKTAL